MSLSLDELRKQVREIVERIRLSSIIQTDDHVPEMPPTLYHYTGVDGFMGILTTGKVWATHAQYLNDSQELVYASTLANEIIADDLRTESVLVRLFLKYLSFYLSDYSTVDTYITSFCAKSDLLSQWRGYGRNLGYALGFDPDDRLSATPIVENARIVKVVYSPTHQRQIIKAHIDCYVSRLIFCDDWFDEDALREIDQIVPIRHGLFD
ncbi:hypothetical protein V5E97_28775 [Singulisphaera sp. Ch08]|uniref:DUF2971 domain-containing protein n=1 Tax=Singulisphaera sp. Ch08 TaxID=3120278 RepID=A0AAU7CAG1_9BACT